MDDFKLFINYLPIIGRVVMVIFGFSFVMIGVIESISVRKAKPLIISLFGMGIILLEVFVPIAIVNAIIAGFVIVLLGLICAIAVTS